MHVWKYHNETPSILQLTCANKNVEKITEVKMLNKLKSIFEEIKSYDKNGEIFETLTL
jgi:hypothetical protein